MISALILLLGGLALWGIKESVIVAAVLTIVEIVGLIIIVYVGADFLVTDGHDFVVPDLSMGAVPWLGVMSGGFLAFYAYIGFEDMVNVAEEVKEPEKNMPRAILIAVIVSTLLYSFVSIVAILVIEPAQLSLSDAPLADVYSVATGKKPLIISLIGIFAVINGALIQMIMASRLLYGMAYKGWLPRSLAYIHPRTNTPIITTVLVIIIVLVLSLLFQIVALAEFTSYLVLIVFTLVNLSLIRIKQRTGPVIGASNFSIWVPVLGFIITLAFLIFTIVSVLWPAQGGS